SLLPLDAFSTNKIALLQIGKMSSFEQALKQYHEIYPFTFEDLEQFSLVIIAANEKSPQLEGVIDFLSKKNKPHVIVLFTSPYALFSLQEPKVLVLAYESDHDAQEAAADVLFGELFPEGHLPISDKGIFTCD